MRILKENNGILKSLIKQKKAIISLDEFIDDIITHFARSAVNDIKTSFNDLIVFAYENFGLDEDSFLNLLSLKIQNLGIKEHKIDKENLTIGFKNENKALDSGVKMGFDVLDKQAMKLIDDSFYWLRTEYNNALQNRVKDAVKDVLSGKLARKDLAIRLKDELSTTLKGSLSYFEGVADNIINQNRNLTTILDRNEGLKYFKVQARMDDKTSEICRSMHGRLIPVKHLDAQAKKILNSKNMSDKKAAAIWQSKAYHGRSDKLPSNFGLPPYHFHCRTMLVPAYVNEYEKGGVKMTCSEEPKDGETIRHIDKSGVERVVSTKRWEHITNGHSDISKNDIIKAMNSIIEIGKNGSIQNRTNTFSSNGIFMVFEGDRLITAYRPNEKKKKSYEYFKNSILKESKEVIKWSLENLI